MRFVRQKNNFSCAPIAILNAAKWAGKKLSYKKDYKRIVDDLKCNKDGTKISNIDRILRQELVHHSRVLKIKNPTYIRAMRHIRSGGSILLAYEPQEDQYHIALFTAIREGHWVGHNIYQDCPSGAISTNKVLDVFYRANQSACVWLLAKKYV